MNKNDEPRNVIEAHFERWFTDCEIDVMEERLRHAASVTIPKAEALRIIRRMRASGIDSKKN